MGYLEQSKRVERWYDRFQSLDRGRQRTLGTEDYVDEVHAFFMSCYHLKDWIKNDDSSNLKPELKKSVEKFIDSRACLKICADVCNGLKHSKPLRKERSRISPDLIAKEIFYNPSKNEIRMKLYIESTTGRLDAFQVATDCMEAWKEFLADASL